MRAGAYLGMAIGRPTKPLNVTPEEREKLAMLSRRPKSAQAIAMRARIVLGAAAVLFVREHLVRIHWSGWSHVHPTVRSTQAEPSFAAVSRGPELKQRATTADTRVHHHARTRCPD